MQLISKTKKTNKQDKRILNFQILFLLVNVFIKNDNKLSSCLHYETDNCSLIVIFSIDDIAKILQNLDSNKTLIKSVFASYNYLVIQSANDWSSFGNNLLRVVLFRLKGKKGNVVTIHKKEDKQCL